MNKFKVGDIAIGNERNRYGITKKGIKVKVKSLELGGAFIRVEVIDGKDKGYEDVVEAVYFDLHVEENKKYTTRYDRKLGITFIAVGDVTLAVPVPENSVGIALKHPEDQYCQRIGEAVSFMDLVKK